MKSIQKGSEPNAFIEYRVRQSNSDSEGRTLFDDFQDKQALRESLAREQGYLCCYCMRRIKPNRLEMKIEHYQTVTDHPELALVYKNLLGACRGGERTGESSSKRNQHCDTHRGNIPLKVNPLNVNECERLIRYTGTGEMISNDPQVYEDIDKTLNLNLAQLKANRKAVLEFVIQGLKKKQTQGNWTNAILQKEIDKWRSQKEEGFREYCQVVVYYLEKKLSKFSN